MTKNKEKNSSPINKIKLVRAFDLCKEADIRYEDYTDRVLCPSSAEEYISMLDWSLDQKENPVFC